MEFGVKVKCFGRVIFVVISNTSLLRWWNLNLSAQKFRPRSAERRSFMEERVEDERLQRKRRKRNLPEWKREIRKRSIIAGEPHFSVNGQLVSRKEIGPDCKCKLRCYEKVGSRLRQLLFESYYSMKSYDEQNAYLFGLIRKHDVKRKKNIDSDRRTCTYKYYVRNEGEDIQVCKLAFANIHAVSFRKIRTLSEKLDQDIVIPRDGRGKHDNRPSKTSSETLDLIKKHIFQIIESDDLSEFLKENKNEISSPELNVTKLYLNFLQLYEPQAIDFSSGQQNPDFPPKVKCWLYRKVFKEEMKFNCDIPKKMHQINREFGRKDTGDFRSTYQDTSLNNLTSTS